MVQWAKYLPSNIIILFPSLATYMVGRQNQFLQVLRRCPHACCGTCILWNEINSQVKWTLKNEKAFWQGEGVHDSSCISVLKDYY